MKKMVWMMTLSLSAIVAGYAQHVQVVRVEGGLISANSVASAEQKEIGKAVMEFMFDYRYLRDTIRMSPAVTDRMILQVGQGLSKFFSYRTMQVDSLIRMSTADQIQADPGRYIGGQTYSIYKNYPAGKLTTTDKIATDWFRASALTNTCRESSSSTPPPASGKGRSAYSQRPGGYKTQQ